MNDNNKAAGIALRMTTDTVRMLRKRTKLTTAGTPAEFYAEVITEADVYRSGLTIVTTTIRRSSEPAGKIVASRNMYLSNDAAGVAKYEAAVEEDHAIGCRVVENAAARSDKIARQTA